MHFTFKRLFRKVLPLLILPYHQPSWCWDFYHLSLFWKMRSHKNDFWNSAAQRWRIKQFSKRVLTLHLIILKPHIWWTFSAVKPDYCATTLLGQRKLLGCSRCVGPDILEDVWEEDKKWTFSCFLGVQIAHYFVRGSQTKFSKVLVLCFPQIFMKQSPWLLAHFSAFLYTFAQLFVPHQCQLRSTPAEWTLQ